MGAALALAETLFKMDKDLASSFTGELQQGATDPHWPVRRSASLCVCRRLPGEVSWS